ncbi:MAG: ATP-binding protein [Candidatus Delongbacteria bacterium]
MDRSNRLAERPRYTDKIWPFVGNGNAKIVTGIRRCGKSSVMRIFSESLGDGNTIYIDMELAENYGLKGWKALLGRVDSLIVEGKRNALFIDEVQNIQGWELAIRDLIARNVCDIYITGSNSDLLSSEYSTHLGGRFNEIGMLPLSYPECVEFRNMYGGDGEVFDRFIRIGGFPILWRNPTDVQSSMQTVRDIVDVSISNDIEIRYGIKNKLLLRDLLRCTVSMIGNYVSANNIYKTLRSSGIRTSTDTVYEYLGFLESANILIRANVFDIKGRKVLSSKYKYYVTDLGIKHALIGYRPEDTPGHMENMIFTELLGRGYEVYVGDSEGKEIDFVAERNGDRMYIQACQAIQSEETMGREFGNLESIRDSFPKYVVMMEPGVYEGVTDKGIVCCGLKEFLSDDI